jgi:glycosyltransferase involved in cell wall biosynthesis
MHILHVIQRYWPYVGGSELQLQEFSERLVRDGHRVTVFTTDAWDLEHFWACGKKRIAATEDEHNGVLIRRFPVRHITSSPLVYPGIRHVMLALAALPFDTTALEAPLARLTPWVPAMSGALAQDDTDYDLVAGMNIVFDGLLEPALHFAHKRNIPFVLHPLTHLGEADDAHVRRHYTMPHQVKLLKQSDAVIVQNPIEMKALAALGVPQERMHIAGSGVNPEQVTGGQADRFRRTYGINSPIVAFLGTAAYDKGAFDSVRAVSLLRARGVNVTLVLAGPMMDQFTTFYGSQPESVRDCCRVLGFISDVDKQDLLAACSALLLPSRSDSFGIVFLEAWLYDKPVIGARAGGIPDVIVDGEDGFLVPFGDVAALADRIGRILADPDLAQRMGENGHRKTLAEMTWAHRYGLVRKVYESVIAARR